MTESVLTPTSGSTFARPLTFCREIVVLNGLTGTGKTMFSPLLSSMTRMQNARFEYTFEYLCITAATGQMQIAAAAALLNLLVNWKYYDGAISRDVNFRPTDLSSVFTGSKGLKYVRQLFMRDGSHVDKRIESENPALLLVTHQLLGAMQPAFDAFGSRVRVVEMVRHPLYLLDHWASCIDRHGKSARDFTVCLDHNGRVVPWYARGWEDRYLASPIPDRVIYAIAELMSAVFDRARRSPADEHLQFVPFEQFVLDPDKHIRAVEELLDVKMTSASRRVLQTQRVPRPSINAGPQKSIYHRYGLKPYDPGLTHEEDFGRRLEQARDRSSADAFTVLERVSHEYEVTFGRWF